MKLSIIIPVYKTAPYLDLCLESILRRQAITDCEIILVDDCSPDSCGKICDDWSRKDSRIKVVHCTKNGGLSKARNIGLDHAEGEYITFVDSDDYLAPDTLSQNMALLDAMPETDVLEYPVHVNHGTKSAYFYRPGACKTESYREWIVRKGYLHSYAWNKIYRSELWKNHRFPVGRLFEDMYTIPYVLRDARKLLSSNKGLYYYCAHSDSISHTASLPNIFNRLQANLKFYSAHVDFHGLSKEDVDQIYLTLCNCQILYLQHGGAYCIPERKMTLDSALRIKGGFTLRCKAVLKVWCGKSYCSFVACIRKLFIK